MKKKHHDAARSALALCSELPLNDINLEKTHQKDALFEGDEHKLSTRMHSVDDTRYACDHGHQKLHQEKASSSSSSLSSSSSSFPPPLFVSKCFEVACRALLARQMEPDGSIAAAELVQSFNYSSVSDFICRASSRAGVFSFFFI